MGIETTSSAENVDTTNIDEVTLAGWLTRMGQQQDKQAFAAFFSAVGPRCLPTIESRVRRQSLQKSGCRT